MNQIKMMKKNNNQIQINHHSHINNQSLSSSSSQYNHTNLHHKVTYMSRMVVVYVGGCSFYSSDVSFIACYYCSLLLIVFVPIIISSPWTSFFLPFLISFRWPPSFSSCFFYLLVFCSVSICLFFFVAIAIHCLCRMLLLE